MVRLNEYIVAANRWVAQNPNDSDAAAVTSASRDANHAIVSQEQTRGRQTGGGATASGEGEGVVSRFIKTVGGAGWGGTGGTTAAQRSRTTRGQRSTGAGAPPVDDDDFDIGPPEVVGLFSAIGRTVSGDFGPGGVAALWNPQVSLIDRPAFRLFMLSTALAVTGAGISYAVYMKKPPSRGPAAPRLESARADLMR